MNIVVTVIDIGVERKYMVQNVIFESVMSTENHIVKKTLHETVRFFSPDILHHSVCE